MNVDVHFHTVPQHFLQTLRRDQALARVAPFEPDARGEGWLRSGERHASSKVVLDPAFYDLSRIVPDMDRMQLDVVALSVLPVLTFDWVSAEIADAGCRVINDGIAEMVQARPDRFVGFAQVPLIDPPRAVAEIERTVKQFGFRGVQIPSHVGGKNYDEPEFFPFFQKCEELDIPVYIHPNFIPGTFPVGKDRLGQVEEAIAKPA